MYELKIIPLTIEKYNELVNNGEIDETAYYKIIDEDDLKRINKYNDFLKSIIALGVRFGQENPNKNVDDITDSAFKDLMISFNGRHPIEERLKEFLKEVL